MGKKAAGGHSFSNRGSGIVFRDRNQDDRSIRYCNRLGCSTRLNSMKGTQIDGLEKAKNVKASSRSTSSKTIAGKSCKSSSSDSAYQKSFQERQKQILQQEKAIEESSNRQGNIEDSDTNNTQGLLEEICSESQEILDSLFSESNPTTSSIQTVLTDMGELELPVLEGLSSYTVASSSKPNKQINHQLGSGNQAVPSRSLCRHSTYASRNSGKAARPSSQGVGTGPHNCGLKTLSCTSVADVLPSSHSSSDLNRNRRIDAIRKGPSGGENSAAKGKGTSASSTGRYSGSTHTGISLSSGTLPEHLMPQQTLIRTRNQPTSRDGAVSVRIGSASTGDSRARFFGQGVGITLPVHEPIVIPHLQENQVSIAEAVPESSSRSSSLELPHVVFNSSGHPGSSSRAARNRTISRPEDGGTHFPHDSLRDRDGYRRFNVDRIAEVLLALDRIEQDAESTYEQLLMLETNFSLGGLSFYDQHREMRMDIDNMSYEELLALEEKMGTVSTALSQDQLSECLKRRIYTPEDVLEVTSSGDDSKCSICQEEYVSGDEVGKLACDHRYHVACIHQWLGQKNWCPICKASAIPS